MTDNEIISLIRSAPPQGRRALFDEYCNYVYAIAASKLRSCGSREDIEECVSDIFAELYRICEKELTAALKAVVCSVAKRRSIDSYRRLSRISGRTVSIDAEDFREPASDERVDERSERSDTRRVLLSKIEELGEPDSTIIIQQYFYNRTASEIAKAVSLTAANVQKRSSRARLKLRELLLEAGISY